MRWGKILSANNHALRSDHLTVWAGVRHLVVCLWGGPILKVGHTPTSVEQVSSELLVSYGCVLTPCLFLPFERCKFHVAQTSLNGHMNLHAKHVARIKFILLVVRVEVRGCRLCCLNFSSDRFWGLECWFYCPFVKTR